LILHNINLEMMRLTDFLPAYPTYHPQPSKVPNLFQVYEEEDMYTVIRRKKEFTDLTIRLLDSTKPLRGEYLKHQLFVQRFLSQHTPYTGLLLWHEVGVGKTISAISVAEAMKTKYKNKVLVLVKGQNVARNFRNEIKKIEPSYISENAVNEFGKVNDKMVTRRINDSYQIATFLTFCKSIKDLSKDQLKQIYSNRVIIIDEVHNLRSKDDYDDEDKEEKKGDPIDKYKILFQLLHVVENCKILLLSATPMKDSSSEFAAIMNLILPESQQFKEDTFDTTFFDAEHRIKDRDMLMSHVKGYISYLRQPKIKQDASGKIIRIVPDVKEKGDSLSLPGFVPLVSLQMEPTQITDYKVSDSLDTLVDKDKSSGIYKETTQSILSCYPSTKDPIKKINQTHGVIGIPSSALVEKMFDARDELEIKLEKVKSYSIKYHYILQKLSEFLKSTEGPDGSPGRKVFIYCKYIDGSGLFLFEQMLQSVLRYQKVRHSEIISDHTDPRKHMKTMGRRYGIITSKVAQGNPLSPSAINDILEAFNHPQNKNGEYIQVLMGSGTIGESRSLTCVRDIFILTPFWNYTETEQAIGRGVRSYSHWELPEDQQDVTIHRLMAVLPPGNKTETIDQLMYKTAFQKDFKIKQIEHVAREIAVDCTFFKEQNGAVRPVNGSRDCFYTTCEFKCFDPPGPKVDRELKDTYNLFYTEKDYQRMKRILQNHFQGRPITKNVSKFLYTLDQLKSLIQSTQATSFPDHVVLRCLHEMIERKERFMDPYGFVCYLKESNNLYFLSYSILFSNESDAYYTSKSQSFPDQGSEEFLSQLEEKRMSVNEDDPWDFRSVTQNVFLFISQLLKQPSLKNKNYIQDYLLLLRDHHPYLYEFYMKQVIQTFMTKPSPLLSSLISILQENNKFIDGSLVIMSIQQRYDLDTQAWIQVNPIPDSDIRILTRYFSRQEETFFGIISDGEFKIRSLKQRPTNLESLQYGKSKGNVCNTANGTKIIEYLSLLGYEIPKETPSKPDLCNTLKQLLSNKLITNDTEEIKRLKLGSLSREYSYLLTDEVNQRMFDEAKRLLSIVVKK
jgi:superfamily II DNA or RNA helicase